MPSPGGAGGEEFCLGLLSYLPLVSRERKNGSNSSYSCTPFLHSLLTKGKDTSNVDFDSHSRTWQARLHTVSSLLSNVDLGFRRSHSDNPGEACGSRYSGPRGLQTTDHD